MPDPRLLTIPATAGIDSITDQNAKVTHTAKTKTAAVVTSTRGTGTAPQITEKIKESEHSRKR